MYCPESAFDGGLYVIRFDVSQQNIVYTPKAFTFTGKITGRVTSTNAKSKVKVSGTFTSSTGLAFWPDTFTKTTPELAGTFSKIVFKIPGILNFKNASGTVTITASGLSNAF
jgi:hypothetical protein